MDELDASLRRLVLIEGAAAVVLLLALAAGAWLVLRRGLRPLEHMATSARSITAGDLSQRVEPADNHSEVGQLGLALNTMLGEIEVAFQEREATEQRLRQFLADASHELRTPLTSIQGFAELFRVGGEKSPVDLAIIMRRIEEESARMKVLVEDLLLLARLDETRPVERQPVDLAVLAADACTRRGGRRSGPAGDPRRTAAGDGAGRPGPPAPGRRQPAVERAAPTPRHGTPIEVAAARDNGLATITVRDHGQGLDDEALRHVFDRFWQRRSGPRRVRLRPRALDRGRHRARARRLGRRVECQGRRRPVRALPAALTDRRRPRSAPPEVRGNRAVDGSPPSDFASERFDIESVAMRSAASHPAAEEERPRVGHRP